MHTFPRLTTMVSIVPLYVAVSGLPLRKLTMLLEIVFPCPRTVDPCLVSPGHSTISPAAKIPDWPTNSRVGWTFT